MFQELRTFFIILMLLFCSWSGLAQKKYDLYLISTDNELPKEFSAYTSFKSIKDRYKALENIQYIVYKEGFLTFSIDSIIESGNNHYAYLHFGETFSWIKLSKGNLDGDVLGSVRFRERIYYQKKIQPKQLSQLLESILFYCENNGYPFAQIKMDSVIIENNKISANLHLDKNKLVTIDSVLIKGSAKTNEKYFQNYLGLKPGKLYNESIIQSSEKWLQELAFVTVTRPTEVVFTEKATKVQLFLNHKKASRFDGIIGFQPNDQTDKITFTGDIKLNLINSFKRGESIVLNWRRLQSATQDILVGFKYPYLFNTQFGADLSFSLYRRDSSFVQVKGNLGVSYALTGTDYIKIFIQPQQSNVLSKTLTPTNGLANVDITLFGLEINRSKYNYRFNPISGYGLMINGAVGNKNIRKNPEFPDSFYDDIALSSTQWTASIISNVFIPITKRNTLMVGAKGAVLQNADMFINELYRIGGMNTIRGFDEESIFASSYGIFTLEYRYLLEKNSNVFLFAEGAWYEANTTASFTTDTPLGFGAGISFETKAGVFSLTYALGRQFNNPVQLKNGKVHFGFINFF